MSSLDKCRICASDALSEIEGYGNLARVTSDCKTFAPGGRLTVCTSCGAVQKPDDAKWRAEADAIYSQYTPYHSSDGAEQAVFDPVTGQPRQRSAVILDRLEALRPLGDRGEVLDVGCGNGALLAAFSSAKPDWTLDGQDISDINLPSLEPIKGFRQLHAKPLPQVGQTYDLVTLMHSLEHFPDPAQGLHDLKNVVREGGCLLVQVPNIEATPFDLLIADHVSHFTRHDLARLFADAGYGPIVIADDWIAKELSVVALPHPSAAPLDLPAPAPPEKVLARVSGQIAWLNAIVEQSSKAAAEGRPFGLFGTSIAATWLYGQLGDRVDFFVDEDPNCQGRSLLGKPILPPADAPKDAIVYVTLIPAIARSVANRLSGQDIDLRVPPDITS